jgi:DNA invertase Pin-like site-specific DNA recombinase
MNKEPKGKDKMHNNSKIKPSHLERKACIYIRQSSPSQVIKHTGSTTRQYNLVDRALELGWGKNQIVIIDEDQATSATSTYGRNAYKNMLSEIIKGNVGAVISIDASARLSREGSDWHLLLNICETSDTLIIDETHIYDMSDPNDRFSLGIKGLFSQAETHTNKDRFTKAKQAKAELGQLRILNHT